VDYYFYIIVRTTYEKPLIHFQALAI